MKRAVQRANVIDYRFAKKKGRKRKRGTSGTAGENTTVTQQSVQNSSTFLGAILNENADNRDNDLNKMDDMDFNSDEGSLSDDGSDCNLNESVFEKDDDVDENGWSPTYDLVDNEDDIDYMGKE